jgi:hypothetical protein
MRLLVEIFIIGALIYLGWETPFRDRLPASMLGATKTQSATQPPRPFVRPKPTPSGAWMRDPNHQTVLDTPRPQSGFNAGAHPRPTASVSGSWMWDSNHHSPLDAPRHASPTPH